MDRGILKERRERRQAFLRKLYDDVDGSVVEFVDGFAIAAHLGADPAEAKRIITYFEEKALLKVDDHKAGIVRLTAAGVDAVEEDAD